MSDDGADAPPLVHFDNVVKRYSGIAAVDGVSLDIRRGEFFALLGPSGCGKTTLLRTLAGFEFPDEGRILLDSENIVPVPPHRRPVNMMFQSYALFPHLSVESNVAFGLKQENMPRAQIAARVAEMMKLVHIDQFALRRPHQLSGGQRQRVALARALVKRPKVFLLDEPLAALDKKLRAQTQFELKELQRRLGLTFIIVTHDQEEAMIMADRIGVMDHGKLVQVGTPVDIYERPCSRWVAEFIGEVNILDGEIKAQGEVTTKAGILKAASGSIQAGTRIALAIRPEKIHLARENETQSGICLPGKVASIAYRGDMSFYIVALDSGPRLKVAIPHLARGVAPANRGERVLACIEPDACVVLTQ